MVKSKIYHRNRAIGYVSNHIPLVTRYIERRRENLIVTCVGKAFHTYGCSHFSLLSVSGVHPEDITCLSADIYHIYTASECNIYAWRRGTELKHVYRGHKHCVHQILPFGPSLISVDEESNVIVWNIKSEEIISEHNFNNEVFKITTLMHPNTYINKILIGSEQGHLELWNVKTSKMLYFFDGWNSSVTVIEQAPALHVVAIGLANGKIILHNIKKDIKIFELIQDWGLVTSISFRTDDTINYPVMATGTLNGHIVFWNLEERKVESQILNAHFRAVSGLKYLPNEQLIVSSSSDNSLKLWICDVSDNSARLLRMREGHSEPPTHIRFYSDDGHNILSAAGDSTLRIFSTVTEIFNKSLGKASFNRKLSKKKGNKIINDHLIMPPIINFVCEKTREKEWDNIAAAHLGLGLITTWSYDKLRMGEHKLLPNRFKKNYNANVTALCLTQCGNFVIIGYSTGHIDRYNIQSGIHRATYGIDGNEAHRGPIKGLIVDPLNQFVMSAGRDTEIKFWAFTPNKDKTPKSTIKLSEGVKWLRGHKESSLVAVALEDFTVILIDLDTKRIVRNFQGHTGHLTDATFNPDSRWLITASMDCTIRTWDIPSAQLIDIFKVPEACISLDFSPTGEYLATVHMSNLGIFLWSNRTLFDHISLQTISLSNIPLINLPGVLQENSCYSENDYGIDKNEANDNYVSPTKIDSKLITMSSLANSRWQNLLNIDIVRKKNKPQNVKTATESAPFFLPTIPSLDLQFDLSNAKNPDDNSRLTISSNFNNLSIIGKLLQDTIKTCDYISVVNKLKSLGPSMIDFEIQSLSTNPTYFVDLTLQFLKMIKFMIKSKQDFELAQVYLGVLLKVNGIKIQNEDKIVKYLAHLKDYQLKHWCRLRKKLFYNISVLKYLKKCN
ncbi:WD repeat-containing protein 36 [Chelonus insularis]|uniref:WD repeat-containing protein 36 n=1 Tax=Chelonus insularis TaxID=460826 RepID=UPI00158EE74C|nr:WD repeat-containing protein 36 [Chelonus insularis]